MSHQIHFNQAKNQLEVTTPYCILDSASLVTPVKFQKDGKEEGEPRHSIRALFDLSFQGAQDFLKDLREECRNLVDHVDQFHPSFLPEEFTAAQVVLDCARVGSEVIAEKKALDLKAEKKSQQMGKPVPKKGYNTAMDYLEGLFYMYARASSKFPPRIFDRDNQVLSPASDEFFAPSFKGKLRLVIKRTPAFGSKDPDTGGSLVAYMNSVQFIRSTPEIDYRRALAGFDKVDSDDEAECMFKIPKKKIIGDDVPDFGAAKRPAAKRPAAKPVSQRKAKDDIDEYNEQF